MSEDPLGAAADVDVPPVVEAVFAEVEAVAAPVLAAPLPAIDVEAASLELDLSP